MHTSATIITKEGVFNKDNLLQLVHKYKDTGHWLYETASFIEQWTNNSNNILIKTSGTTGPAKDVCLSKESIRQSAMLTIQYFNLHEGDTALLSLPVSYIAGKMMIVRSLVAGLTLYLLEPTSNPMLKLDRAAQIKFAPFVPFQLETMLNNETTAKRLGHISTIITGGASMNGANKNADRSLAS
ncbi:MAG: AMP-binding protein [Bacteroidales bacterium]|nr:AMP-binding protein [Bacteroidales bacterium]